MPFCALRGAPESAAGSLPDLHLRGWLSLIDDGAAGGNAARTVGAARPLVSLVWLESVDLPVLASGFGTAALR
jgi:hypothetical protein